jgi:hypothetical protein
MQIDRLRITEILVLDKADVSIRQDGSMLATPRVGRIGIQLYKGSELGRNDMPVVRVYRPESEVMDKAAMASVTHRPVTNDHPSELVTADNWKKYAVGHTGDTVARDGEFIRVPMMLSDGGVIRDYNDGKKQLSLGYTSNLEWRQGETPQGEKYDAVQTNIRINHLAVVDAARGGPKLSIGDTGVTLQTETIDLARKAIAAGKFNRDAADLFLPVTLAVQSDGGKMYPFMKDGVVYRKALESIKAQAVADQMTAVVAVADELLNLMDAPKRKRAMTEKTMTTIMIDGQAVEVTDLAAGTILRKLEGLKNEASDLHSKFATAAAKQKETDERLKAAEEDMAAKKKKMDEDAATIVTLKAQLDAAKITPQKLDALVRDRSVVVAKGRALIGDKLVLDGKTDGEMRRQVVAERLGDACKDWNDDQIASSFATLTADVKIDVINAADQMRHSFSGAQNNAGGKPNSDASYNNYDKKISDQWRGDAAASK